MCMSSSDSGTEFIDLMRTRLHVALDVRDVLEEGNHDREEQHESNGEKQRPREDIADMPQRPSHVEVEAQLHDHRPAHKKIATRILTTCAASAAI